MIDQKTELLSDEYHLLSQYIKAYPNPQHTAQQSTFAFIESFPNEWDMLPFLGTLLKGLRERKGDSPNDFSTDRTAVIFNAKELREFIITIRNEKK